MRSIGRLVVCLFAAAAVFPGAARAQEQWSWPEKPKNLQVLPKDFTGKRLAPIMKGFTRSLGVRCQYCHVGEEGKPLSTFDFASDANPMKDRAREMYRMLGDINGHLKKIEPSGDKRVNMWCFTCHRGRPRPMTLGEELGEVYRKSGSAAAIARYKDLRERFYGRGSYDFGEGSLADFGGEILEKGDRDGAIAILRLNTEEFPRSGDAWEGLGEAYLAAGQKPQAKSAFQKSLELDPHNEDALAKMRELEDKPPQ